MSINQFFNDILQAKLKNPRWSWGATDRSNRVFLRVWRDQIARDPNGERVIVCFKEWADSPAKAEREKHINAIRRGAEAFGVLCIASEAHTNPSTLRKIHGFDRDRLLRLGAISEDDKAIYGRTRVPGRTEANY